MADAPVPVAAPVAAPASPVPSPVAAAPVAAPIAAPVVESASPAAVETTVAPVVAAPAVEAPIAESVLSAATEVLVKPEGEVKEGEPAIEAPAPAPVQPLTYEAFKFPEGIKLDDAEVKGYTDIFGKHQIPQPVVQELIDYHTAQLAESNRRQQTVQREVWNSTRQGWVNDFKASDIGGNRAETTLAQAGGVMERYAGGPEQLKELRNVLTMTGAGDHPAVIRLLANVGKVLGEGRPVPATHAKAAPTKSTARGRYNNSST